MAKESSPNNEKAIEEIREALKQLGPDPVGEIFSQLDARRPIQITLDSKKDGKTEDIRGSDAAGSSS